MVLDPVKPCRVLFSCQEISSGLFRFHTNHDGRGGHDLEAVNFFECLLHVTLPRFVSHHHHWDGPTRELPPLNHGGNADVMIAQNSRDLGEDARAVESRNAEVVRTADLVNRFDPLRGAADQGEILGDGVVPGA